ncbi:MAG: hypothetical protein FWG78_00855 [Coriobacteriia bacterium]|nr:hypothetical protein [Coriobacteriia bacterium]
MDNSTSDSLYTPESEADFAVSGPETEPEPMPEETSRERALRRLRIVLAVLGAGIVLYAVVIAALVMLGWTPKPLPSLLMRAGDEIVHIEEELVGAVGVAEKAVVETHIEEWSDAELAAQVCMVMVPARDAASHIETWTKRNVGAIVLDGVEVPRDLAAFVGKARRDAPRGVAPLIASNVEGGSRNDMATIAGPLDSAQTFGTKTPAQIEREVALYAAELAKNDLSLVLGPSADLAMPGCAIAREQRGFSSNPNETAAAAAAWVRGMESAGIGTVLKHWPGIGGYADVSGPLVAFMPWNELEKTHARAFADAHKAGHPAAVMVGHVVVPGFTEDGTPASTSKRAYDYVREMTGNDTLLITDNLGIAVRTQNASANTNAAVAQTAVGALQAGADLILFAPSPDAETVVIDAIVRALDSGTLSRSALRASARRVVQVKVSRNLAPEFMPLGTNIKSVSPDTTQDTPNP